MIKNVFQSLTHVDIVINVVKAGDKIVVSVLPRPKTDDPSAKSIVPFIVTGTDPDEVDKLLIESLEKGLPQVAELTNSMNHYLDSVKQMEAKSKMNEEQKKKADELENKIKEKLKDVDDLIEENKLDEVEKLILSALKMDANSKLVQKAKDKLNDAKAKGGTDLFAVISEAPKYQERITMSEEQIEMEMQSRTTRTITI